MTKYADVWIGCHSDNYQVGRMGYAPEMLVNHRAGGSIAGVDSWFNTGLAARQRAQPRAGRSSAHCCVRKDGIRHHYVAMGDTAYANGGVDKTDLMLVRANAGINPNYWTYSIELEGVVGDALTPAQRESLVEHSIVVFRDHFFPGGASDVAVDRDHVVKHDDISYTACPAISEGDLAAIITDIRIGMNPAATPKPIDWWIAQLTAIAAMHAIITAKGDIRDLGPDNAIIIEDLIRKSRIPW